MKRYRVYNIESGAFVGFIYADEVRQTEIEDIPVFIRDKQVIATLGPGYSYMTVEMTLCR